MRQTPHEPPLCSESWVSRAHLKASGHSKHRETSTIQLQTCSPCLIRSANVTKTFPLKTHSALRRQVFFATQATDTAREAKGLIFAPGPAGGGCQAMPIWSPQATLKTAFREAFYIAWGGKTDSFGLKSLLPLAKGGCQVEPCRAVSSYEFHRSNSCPWNKCQQETAHARIQHVEEVPHLLPFKHARASAWQELRSKKSARNQAKWCKMVIVKGQPVDT